MSGLGSNVSFIPSWICDFNSLLISLALDISLHRMKPSTAFTFSGCHFRLLQTGWLRQQTLFSHRSGAWNWTVSKVGSLQILHVRNPSLPLPTCGGSWHSLACAKLSQLPSLLSFLPQLSSESMSSPPHIRAQVLGFRAHSKFRAS